jgi:glycosyltransferase involved in cell wall biosynthesis
MTDTVAVICAYNEGNSLFEVIRETYKVLIKCSSDFSIIVVDDGSTNGTFERLKQLRLEIPYLKIVRHPANRGYGAAMYTGLKEARKEKPSRFVTLDGDGQHDPKWIPKLFKTLESADYVLGVPIELKDVKYGVIKNIWRGGWTDAINRLCPYNHLTYITGGIRAGNSKALEAIQLPPFMDGFSPAEAMAFKADFKKLKIVNEPVTYRERRDGKSFINPLYPIMNFPFFSLVILSEILKQPIYGLKRRLKN